MMGEDTDWTLRSHDNFINSLWPENNFPGPFNGLESDIDWTLADNFIITPCGHK